MGVPPFMETPISMASLGSKRCKHPMSFPPDTSKVIWLVVYLPLWKIWKSRGRIIPYIMENHRNVLNHQPVIGGSCRSGKLSRMFDPLLLPPVILSGWLQESLTWDKEIKPFWGLFKGWCLPINMLPVKYSNTQIHRFRCVATKNPIIRNLPTCGVWQGDLWAVEVELPKNDATLGMWR